MRETILLFRETVAEQLSEIDDALDEGDSRRVERIAHTIKGAAQIFAAQPTIDAAASLESLGRRGRLDVGKNAFALLRTELGRLSAALDALDTTSVS